MAEQTLLQIVQEFCRRTGLPIPPVAFAATDDTTLQVVGLLNEGIQAICDRYSFQQLATQQTFTHGNGADYMALDFGVLVPGWKYDKNQTLWNLTTRIPVAGPLTLPEWQRVTTLLMAAAQYQYIIYGNGIHIYPVPNPVASITFGFYYQSKYGINGSTGQQIEAFASDSDKPRLPTYLLLADLKWRWKKEKSLPYAEDQRECESMLVNSVGRQPYPTLSLNDGVGEGQASPGIFIRPGSWLT